MTANTNPQSTSPILSVGNYGLHILRNPAGSFSFFGTVPEELHAKNAETFDDAFELFAKWFLAMPVEEQREHAANLRNDVFVKLFSK